MVDPFVQSQQNTAVSADNEHTEPAFGGSVDAFDAMTVGPYQPEPLSIDPFAEPTVASPSDSSEPMMADNEDPFVRMGKEESAPINSPFSDVEQTEATDVVDPFIVGDPFDHSLTEATILEETPVAEKAPENVPVSPTKEAAPKVDPVTVVEPALEPDHAEEIVAEEDTTYAITEEHEDEPVKEAATPLLQKLATLVSNIHAIISEDETLLAGIPLLG